MQVGEDVAFLVDDDARAGGIGMRLGVGGVSTGRLVLVVRRRLGRRQLVRFLAFFLRRQRFFFLDFGLVLGREIAVHPHQRRGDHRRRDGGLVGAGRGVVERVLDGVVDVPLGVFVRTGMGQAPDIQRGECQPQGKQHQRGGRGGTGQAPPVQERPETAPIGGEKTGPLRCVEPIVIARRGAGAAALHRLARPSGATVEGLAFHGRSTRKNPRKAYARSAALQNLCRPEPAPELVAKCIGWRQGTLALKTISLFAAAEFC